MTYAYGAGQGLREKVMQELLIEELKEKGVLNPDIKQINELTVYISQYFQILTKLRLGSAVNLKNISELIGKNVQSGISMITPYGQWNMYPLLTERIEVSIKGIYGKKLHRTIYHKSTEEINRDTLVRSFGATYVHGGDALIAHIFLDKSTKLKTKLKVIDIILAWYLNHDSIGYNLQMQFFVNFIM
jgi:hypothetical protein